MSKPPKDNILKTIWIFTALKKSIRSGEYLTSRLYIPPDIWVQDGAKLAGLHPKLAVFESVVDTLNQLQVGLNRYDSQSLASNETILDASSPDIIDG